MTVNVTSEAKMITRFPRQHHVQLLLICWIKTRDYETVLSNCTPHGECFKCVVYARSCSLHELPTQLLYEVSRDLDLKSQTN